MAIVKASEDWWALWIGLLVFALSLCTLAGTDLLGSGVTTQVWLSPPDALARGGCAARVVREDRDRRPRRRARRAGGRGARARDGRPLPRLRRDRRGVPHLLGARVPDRTAGLSPDARVGGAARLRHLDL